MLSLIRKTVRNIGLKPYRTNVLKLRHLHATGLYGFDQLKTHKGFRRFVDEAIERSGEMVTYISGMPSSAEIIRAMDEISNTVCSVIDSAELCRNTHPDREFVKEANKASMRINEYLHITSLHGNFTCMHRVKIQDPITIHLILMYFGFLNTNHDLYNAVKKAEQDGHLLTIEAQRAAHSLRVDFEKGGIHLCAGKLDKVNQLNMEIDQLCREFSENIMTDPGHVDIYPSTSVPKCLHHLIKPIYRPKSVMSKNTSASRNNLKEKGFRMTTEPANLSYILQWTTDDKIRRMAYYEGNSVPRANLGVLDKLISARHELAQIMGYTSYAEFAVKSNIALSPEVVKSFLLEMSKMVRPKADEEFKKISEFKREHCGEMCGDLEPWDEAYYTAKMKSCAYDLNSSVVASYFPLPQCIEGLKLLVESLFGATFRSVSLAPGESWHPDVLKMALHHPEEGDLGYLYLDLYSRKGKYPGCAHFAIKGGRRISETEYQLPVVALICNFSSSYNSSVVRLNHAELETLFHEFGHALHSLLSRTEYQHFSGTRVGLELAETPSNLFEYYASDYRFLRTFARHYSTGEIIPEKLVKSMRGARDMFAATEMQRQIFYALIDQTLFGEQLSPSRDTVSVIADLKREYTSWKHMEGTHWHTRFSHLLNYGAGYYSYLYAKCFAATIWKKLCQEDPLSLATGTALRTKLLQNGGAKEPADMLTDLVQDGILRYSNGGILPDISCLRDELEEK